MGVILVRMTGLDAKKDLQAARITGRHFPAAGIAPLSTAVVIEGSRADTAASASSTRS